MNPFADLDFTVAADAFLAALDAACETAFVAFALAGMSLADARATADAIGADLWAHYADRVGVLP